MIDSPAYINQNESEGSKQGNLTSELPNTMVKEPFALFKSQDVPISANANYNQASKKGDKWTTKSSASREVVDGNFKKSEVWVYNLIL